MKRINNFLQLVLEYPVIALVIIYVYWFITVPIDMVLWGLILLCAYFAATILEKFHIKNEIVKSISIISYIPFAALGIYYAFWGMLLLFDYGIRSLSSVLVFFLGFALIVISANKKFSDNRETTLKITFAISSPILCLNIIFFAIYYPSVIDRTRLGAFNYFIIEGVNDDFHSYQSFYKCRKWTLNCEVLFSSHGYIDSQIIVDKQNNEVSLFENSNLQYTDGPNPRFYDGYSIALKDHVYAMALSCDKPDPADCKNATHILYECETEYKSCNPLPIQYTDYSYYSYLELESNGDTDEINLYDSSIDPPTLIFTYGEHSRCYVEGCEILEE